MTIKNLSKSLIDACTTVLNKSDENYSTFKNKLFDEALKKFNISNISELQESDKKAFFSWMQLEFNKIQPNISITESTMSDDQKFSALRSLPNVQIRYMDGGKTISLSFMGKELASKINIKNISTPVMITPDGEKLLKSKGITNLDEVLKTKMFSEDCGCNKMQEDDMPGDHMRVKVKDFSDFLINRDQHQGDGTFNAVEFRQKYLKSADDEEWWRTKSDFIELDFGGVDTLGPSWANEAFAYFAKFANKSGDILKRIRFINISPVKLALIKKEIESGYNDAEDVGEPLTLEDRRAFMKLPLEERRKMMAKQAKNIADDYESELKKMGKELGELSPDEKKVLFNKVDSLVKAKNEESTEEVSEDDQIDINKMEQYMNNKKMIKEVVSISPEELSVNGAVGVSDVESQLPIHADVLADSSPVDGKIEYRLFVQFNTNTMPLIVPPPSLPGAPSISMLRELVEDLPFFCDVVDSALVNAVDLPKELE